MSTSKSQRRVTKAVFPVAGLGTRFLPATKSIPKESVALVDRPLIQYAVDEARDAGIEKFIFVTSRGKSVLEDHFDESPVLAEKLRRTGKNELLEEIERSNLPSGSVAYVRQSEPLGLGHAVWCARHLVGDEPFAVILPDDIIHSDTPCLTQMLTAYEQTGGSMVAAMEVPSEQVSRYGVLDIGRDDGALVEAQGLVEKPTPEDAPSTLAVVGRYVLSPSVMERLGEVKSGAGGEIQLTDAIADEIGRAPVHGFRFEGSRYDCGSKAGYLEATVALALSRGDLRDRFLAFLHHQISQQVAAE